MGGGAKLSLVPKVPTTKLPPLIPHNAMCYKKKVVVFAPFSGKHRDGVFVGLLLRCQGDEEWLKTGGGGGRNQF